MDKMDGLSLDLEKQNINKIKELFPEAVEEGKINFEMLRAFLGDEVDDSREKYQFTWNGKAKSIKLAQTPSSATLRPCKHKSKNWDTTENLYIEGDNLEVLKQLQKTYYGKIKMIYIDPPYNTGKDFIYPDDYKDSIENYKEQTNQILSSNPETSGKYHTKWLNMMYPRLILAKNLLRKDGIIFISIDDNEQDNLKKMCNEIFGESNYITEIAWQCLDTVKNDARYFSDNHEYIFIYAKNKDYLKIRGIKKGEKQRAYYKNYDNDPRGDYLLTPLHAKSGSMSSIYTYTFKNGQTWTPPQGTFPRFAIQTLQELEKENRLYLDPNGIKTPQKKTYLSEVGDRMPPTSFWDYSTFGSTRQSNNELSKLNLKGMFQNTKPTLTLKTLIDLIKCETEDIILDFFSGSASTAHAVMKLNAEDGGNRKFIMVQLPELCDEKSEAYKAGYKNICEIGEERIRRAGEQIRTEWEKGHPSDGMFSEDEKFNVDIGFKVFKLDSTNIVPWDSSAEYNEENLFNLSNVFKNERSKADILYEIMLKYGVFDRSVEEIDVNGKTMYRVGKRYMIVCLEDNVTSDDVKAIGELSPKTVIFKESGFNNDNDKINAVYNLEKSGVEDVKCI